MNKFLAFILFMFGNVAVALADTADNSTSSLASYVTDGLTVVGPSDSLYATNINSYWSGDYNSTYSTLLITKTIDYVSTVYYVATPEVHVETTVSSSAVTYWNGTVTSTYSTSFSTFEGTDGYETVETFYYLATPISRYISTSYSFWSGDADTTYSTSVFTVSDNNSTSPEQIHQRQSTQFTTWRPQSLEKCQPRQVTGVETSQQPFPPW
ncbi:hypothetical protein HANVADRAFT_63755 [Hanseniaspora valbyensis NRRL Y-1626]|uniref:Uncharacterized protein n=1 Tax=Hanseniaspora valbyensis NRRL Y-1626 TaxID=766949 RepID=A0A1B7T997_9ASCO|nr:hypothetical protein HANVADRAFT_63755 [Hanseniaspora valbyensis NRRL Y-1626]